MTTHLVRRLKRDAVLAALIFTGVVLWSLALARALNRPNRPRWVRP